MAKIGPWAAQHAGAMKFARHGQKGPFRGSLSGWTSTSREYMLSILQQLK